MNHTYNLYHLIASSYLASDMRSAGSPGFDWNVLDSATLDELWDKYDTALNYTRNTSYYSHFIKGFQQLYGFNDLFFTQENIKDLSAMIEKNYRDYRAWFDGSFHKAGYELMFLDQYWNPFNVDLDDRYFALVFHINPLVMGASHPPREGEELSGCPRYHVQRPFQPLMKCLIACLIISFSGVGTAILSKNQQDLLPLVKMWLQKYWQKGLKGDC